MVATCEKFSGVAFGFHSAPWSFPLDTTFGHLRNATCRLQGLKPGALQLVVAGPRVLTPPRSPPWEGFGSVVLRACGGYRPSILWLLGASRQGWYLPAVSGDLNVTSCMTPKVRSLDGVVCVLLCVGLNPEML